jgi:rod shape-determining protein MreC
VIRDTKSSRVLLAAALVGVLGVAVVDSRTGGADSPLHPVRTVAASVFAPVQSGIVYVTHPVV